MKIVICPDSFKGSLSAAEAADAIAAGIRATGSHNLVLIPLADGGEGTLDAFERFTPGSKRVSISCCGPLGSEIQASYLQIEPGTVVVECAAASGLTLVPPHLRNPLHTTSFGTGQLLAHAMAHGARSILVGLGGSATHDCGIGLMQAVGYRFSDAAGAPLPVPARGQDLHTVATVQQPALGAPRVTVTIASDVTNPLLGPNGAAYTFAPQKGADAETVEWLERGSEIAARCFEELQHGTAIAARPGSGAAGGMAAALIACFGATVVSGIDLVLQRARFAESLRGADLVVTGEGSLDSQSFGGKVLSGVMRAASGAGVPICALAGRVTLSPEQARGTGIAHVFALSDLEPNTAECMANARALLQQRARDAVLATMQQRADTAS